MLWIGIAIVLLTFWYLYKNYEARLVLVIAGVVMTILGQCAGSTTTLEVAANAFIKQLVGGTLVTTIVTENDLKNLTNKPLMAAIPHWEMSEKK